MLIDDGSNADSVSQLHLWQGRQAPLLLAAPVTLLEPTRHFGKEAAMLAGLDHVPGRLRGSGYRFRSEGVAGTTEITNEPGKD